MPIKVKGEEGQRKDTSQIFIPTPATKSTANPIYAPVHTAYAKNGTALYHAKNWFGFKIDKENSDSNAAVIYTHSAVTMTPAHMNYTTGVFDYGSWANVWFVKDLYPVALNFDGTEAYRLNPNDYTKKLDGTDSDIQYVLQTEEPSDWATRWKQYYAKSGDEYIMNSSAEAPAWAANTYYTLKCLSDTVNFMVAFPKVYFKRFEDERYNYIEVCDKKLGDDWYAYAHINTNGDEVDHIYLSMFKGVIKDSKLRSVPGVIPQGNTTASAEVTAAEALGPRWQIWDHSARELINDLLTLMSKSIDSQTSFGRGRESGYDASDTVTYGKLQTGTAIRKGVFYGASNSLSEVKVFGIESFWANRWERLQGILLVDNVWKIKMTPPYNFTGTDFVTLANTPVPSNAGYISQLSTSQYGSLPASTSNGSYNNAFYRDYFNTNQTGTRVGLVGGACGNGAADGFRSVAVSAAASASYRNFGASPIYK